MWFAPGVFGPPIRQGQHPTFDEPARFLADLGALNPGLTATRGYCLAEQYNRTGNFIVVLKGINEVELKLCEFFWRRHRTRAPEQQTGVARLYLS
jgi:hypothetical protein